MFDKTKKLMDMTEELMNDFMKEMGASALMELDGAEFEMMKKCMNLYELSKEVALEQAKQMDDMNKKLDKILEAVESH